MNSRTCDNCNHYQTEVCPIYHHDLPFDRCPHFGGKRKPTNGDAILAGGIKSLVKFHLLGTCDTCIYYNKKHTSHNDICLCPKDKTCADGIEAWLDAPAESEAYDETTSN